MKLVLASAVALFSVAAPAAAQTTTCLRSGVLVTCSSEPGAQPTAPDLSKFFDQRSPDQIARDNLLLQQRRREAEARAAMVQAGRFAADGKCDEAAGILLRNGLFKEASDLRSACVAK